MMIESTEGIKNADAIAAVPGVGAIFLGAGSDLRQSLGVEENSPEIEQAFQTILRACLGRKVACGIMATTAQGIAQRLGEGWKMIRTTNGALNQWRASQSGR
jgi:4-hydroxy-2-oxoheptanedioate aldolase